MRRPPLPAESVGFTLAINPDGVERLKKRSKAPTDKEFARVLGVDQGQLSRVLAGKAVPGARFVGGAVRAFGWHALKDLFIAVPVDDRSDEGSAA